jgi:WD40-like Beta Propeller Repeat
VIAAATTLVAIAAIAWLWQARASVPPAQLLTLGIDVGADTALAGVGWAGLNWVGPTAVISPDGRRIVFIARGAGGGRWQLHSRRLDELRATALPGTEGAVAPFFSPDSRAVGFFARGQLMKVALDDGAVTAICPAEEARGGAWTQDGTIVFAPRPDGPLSRVSSGGGTPSQATTLDASTGEISHRWPEALPDGKGLLFTAHTESNASRPGAIVATAANELAGNFSPDGRWVAYTSDESGRSEVYVQPFPGAGGRWQVSTEGAEWIEWPKNDQLLYGRSEEVVMTVAYHVAGNTLVAAKPRVWMRIPPGVAWTDPAPDLTRAAVIASPDPRRESLVLVVNFFERLLRRQ